MSSVVIVTCDFPPYCGQTGWMIRAVTMAGFLVEQGFDVTVIAARRSKKIKLLSVHPDVRMVWVLDFFEYFKYDERRWLRRPMNILGVLLVEVLRVFGMEVFDKSGLSIGAYKRRVERIYAEDGIENVIITSPPHSLQKLTLWIKKWKPDVNIISDFRDGWSIRPMYGKTKRIRQKTELIEEKVFSNADYVVFVSNGMKNLYRNRFFIDNVVMVENGYTDVELVTAGYDFTDMVLRYRTAGRIVLGYFGSGTVGYENGEKDLAIILRLIERYEGLRNRFAVVLQGRIIVHPKFISETEHTIFPPAEHAEVMGNMRLVDLGLNINVSSEYAPCVIGGKVYEYIYNSRPLLIIAPAAACSLKEIVLDTNGYFVDIDDPHQAVETFREIARHFQRGDGLQEPQIDAERRVKYSRNYQYKKLLKLLVKSAS